MQRMLAPAAAALLALLLAAPALGQFKWTDAKGRVNYGDNPPADAQNVERVGARAPDAADPLAGVPFEVRRAVQNFPVVLYTAADCPACQQGRELLLARGVPFAERTIGSREDVEEARRLGLGDLVPVLAVGRQMVRTPDFPAWQATLDAAGYPRSAILPRTYRNPPARPLRERPAPAPAQ